MKLNDAQKQTVAKWIEQGLKVAEVQKRLAAEFGLRLTFLDVKLLIGDLDLVPRDQPEKPPARPEAPAKGAPPPPEKAVQPAKPAPETAESQPAKGVAVTVDELPQPGAIASGGVTFSDGMTATWYVDELGQLGVMTQQKDYRPSAADFEQFQNALEQALSSTVY
jgi:hypothetical protein